MEICVLASCFPLFSFIALPIAKTKICPGDLHYTSIFYTVIKTPGRKAIELISTRHPNQLEDISFLWHCKQYITGIELMRGTVDSRTDHAL